MCSRWRWVRSYLLLPSTQVCVTTEKLNACLNYLARNFFQVVAYASICWLTKVVPNVCCECDEVIEFSRENICQVFLVMNSCFLITFKYLQIIDPAVRVNIRPCNPFLITPFGGSSLKKLIHVMVLQAAKIYPMFFGIWRFMTVFTIAYSWYLYWTRWILSTDWYLVRLRSILLLTYTIHLSVICRHLPGGFLTKTMCHFASV
jgi:hypothetical protein